MEDNFFFSLISSFAGYVSSIDKTNAAFNILVRGSQNVYKKLSGTIANRFGQLRRGTPDGTQAGVDSAYVWNNSLGKTIPLRICNGKFQFESDFVDGKTLIWYTLLSGITLPRFVFDTWWDQTNGKDHLLSVHGDSTILDWSGGFSLIAGGTNNTGVVGAIALGSNHGAGYAVGDIVIISGGSTPATVLVTGITNTSGALSGVSVGFGGSGYTIGDVLTVTGADGTGGTVTVTSIDGSGAVTGISVTAGGSGYTAQNNAPTSGGTGTLCSISITSLSTSAVSSVQLQTVGSGYSAAGNQATTGGTGTGLTITISNVYAGTITKLNTATTFQQDGFSASGSITINDANYSYSALVGTTMVGINAATALLVSGSLAYQTVLINQNLPIAGFINDFIKIVNNQAFVGSYNSLQIYVSSASDYTNFTPPASNPALGDPVIIVLDNPAKGIGVRQGNAHIFNGTSDLSIITFAQVTTQDSSGITFLTRQTNVQKVQLGNLSSALAHEFIDTLGDNLVYLDQNNQLRGYGTFRNLFSDTSVSLSQQVHDDLQAEDFTGGELKVISGTLDDVIYLVAPISGRTWFYQERSSLDPTGNVIAERLWHPPQIWDISRIVAIDGVVFGHSNANPQIYQLWDTGQWHDDSPSSENLPYTSIMAMSYFLLEEKGKQILRQGLLKFDKIYYEGYMTLGTILYSDVDYNYQGAEQMIRLTINSVQSPATFFSGNISPSLGDESLGDDPLGQGITFEQNDEDMLPKFRDIENPTLVNCFEYQLAVFSEDVDARWEMLSLGSNATETEEFAGFLIKQT